MSSSDIHKFHYAIVSKIPESFARNAHLADPNNPIDLNLATRQHDEYVDVLRRLGIDILELPPDENHPECVFVADVAVVINGTALICKPNGPERRIGEVGVLSMWSHVPCVDSGVGWIDLIVVVVVLQYKYVYY